MYIYIYIYTYIYSVYIHIYIYIEREREGGRERYYIQIYTYIHAYLGAPRRQPAQPRAGLRESGPGGPNNNPRPHGAGLGKQSNIKTKQCKYHKQMPYDKQYTRDY